MKLNNIFFIALFINVLSLGSQLLCQEVPEITYHAHIAPLRQHAAQIIAPFIEDVWAYSEVAKNQSRAVDSSAQFICQRKVSPRQLDIEKRLIQVPAAYKFLTYFINNFKYTSDYPWFGNRLANCFILDDADTLSYLIEKNPAKKSLASLQDFVKKAATTSAVKTLTMLLSHTDNPSKILTPDLFFDAISAIEKGKPDCISLLLPYVDDIPNITLHRDNRSLLATALEKNVSDDVIQKIITLDSSKIFDNSSDSYEKNLLFLATKNNRPATAKLLLEHRADPDTNSSGLDRDTNSYYDSTPLLCAIDNKNEKFVKLLLSFGANPNKAINRLGEDDGDKVVPLCSALEKKLPSIVTMLLNAGADCEQKLNEEGETALHRALKRSNPDMVDALINLGADVNATTKTLLTPLHYAAWREAKGSSTKCMEQLIAANVALDKTDIQGNTALHEAALNNNFRGVLLLLKHGADQEIKNNRGHTASTVAKPGAKAVFDSFALGKKARQA
jgi:ankyrin repeat protein